MPNQVSYSFIALDRFSRIAERIKRKSRAIKVGFKDLGRQARDTSQKIRGLSQRMSAFGAKAAIVSAGIVALGVAMVAQSARFESLEVSFKNLADSAEEGSALFKELADFAAKTPFQFQGIAESAKLLLAFGIPSEKITKDLARLGDVAAATGKPLGEFALLFGQIKSKGKLTGEELLRFAEKGLNLKEVLSEKLNLSSAQFEDTLSKGLITFEDVREALVLLTSEGGRFFGQTAEASKTLEGRFSTLKDNVTFAADAIGDVIIEQLKLKDVMVTLTEKVQGFTAGFREFAEQHPGLIKVGLAIAGIVAVVGPLVLALAALGFVASGVVAGFGAIGAIAAFTVSPIFAVIAAIAGLITLGVLLVKNWDAVKAAVVGTLKEISDSILRVQDAITGFITGKLGSALGFLGIDVNQASRTEIDMTVRSAKGTVKNVKSKSTGPSPGVGLNMVEEPLPGTT